MDSISTVSRQLKMYPIAVGLCMLPLCGFLLIAIVFGKEVKILLYVGAILVSSIGTFNAIVFFKVIVSNPSSAFENKSNPTHITTINPISEVDFLSDTNTTEISEISLPDPIVIIQAPSPN